MIVGSVILAVVGLGCLSVSIIYVIHILRELYGNEDLALARIFLSQAVHRAFLVLSIGAGVLSICMILAAIGTMAAPPLTLLTEAPTIGAIAVASGFLYFTRTIATVVRERRTDDH
ncbi:MAG: hypothetical protein MUP66_03700 [Candidatus Nanohaloarchaeota archaeon QJJ-5]|nr:hypothetical protein [Candidatus Nanohaloarchaeota archaeon QJJ-5]